MENFYKGMFPALPKQIILHIFVFLHVGDHIKASCLGKGAGEAVKEQKQLQTLLVSR